MKNQVKVTKNTGSGGRIALEIPMGMTGRRLKAWKQKNKLALKEAREQVIETGVSVALDDNVDEFCAVRG